MCKHWIKSSEVVIDPSKIGDVNFSVRISVPSIKFKTQGRREM